MAMGYIGKNEGRAMFNQVGSNARILLAGLGYVNTIAILWAVQLRWVEPGWDVAGMWLYCFVLAIVATGYKSKKNLEK